MNILEKTYNKKNNVLTELTRPLTEKEIMPNIIKDKELTHTKIQYSKIPIATIDESQERNDGIPPSLAIPQIEKRRQLPNKDKQVYQSVNALKDILSKNKQETKEEDLFKKIDTELDEEHQDMDFMIGAIKKTRNIRTLKAIAKEAEEKGYTTIVLEVEKKIKELNKEKMEKARAARKNK